MRKNTKAIIYCRTANSKQAKKINSIQLQEKCCREFIEKKGYKVAQVFSDEGFSGNTLERPSLQKMLTFLKEQRGKEKYIVVIDNISTLTRNMSLHVKLRETLRKLDVKLESPTIKFEDTPNSILMENIMAAHSEMEMKLIEELEENSL